VSSQIQDSAKITSADAKVTGDPIRFTLPQFVVDYNDLLKITHSDVVCNVPSLATQNSVLCNRLRLTKSH
jgi:hypothetical protein